MINIGWIFAGVFFLISIFCILALFYQNLKSTKTNLIMKKEFERREYEFEMDKRKAEIVSLQSQINPHFLYNTLEVIRSEAIINQDTEAAEMAEALANYFRYNISKKKDIVTLGEELDNIDNYINIQKKRFGKRIQYQLLFHTDEEEARCALMPRLVIQPLVENAIYHGLEKKAQGGTVIVHITVTTKRLIIQVEDDGPGMDREVRENLERQLRGELAEPVHHDIINNKHGGIALLNINKRVQMLYGKNFGLSFSSTQQVGVEAEVTLPYHVNE